MKKKIIYIALCVVLALGSFIAFALHKTWHNESISVENSNPERNTDFVTSSGETNFFYDDKRGGICKIDEAGTVRLLVNTGVIECIAANSNSVYYVDSEYLFQMDYEGKKQNCIQIKESVSGMYANDEVLFLQCSGIKEHGIELRIAAKIEETVPIDFTEQDIQNSKKKVFLDEEEVYVSQIQSDKVNFLWCWNEDESDEKPLIITSSEGQVHLSGNLYVLSQEVEL